MSNLIESSAIEAALISNDLSKLSAEQRLSYYNNVCESMGLNPLTQPFAYITLNGKLTLYAKRDATDQLRKVHKISINITARENIEGVYIVTARARDGNGREDESTGAVAIANLKGDALANAFLKAETKAKRRVTLSICGLGFLDETEVEAIHQKDLNVPGARLEKQIEAIKERQDDKERRASDKGSPKAEGGSKEKPGENKEISAFYEKYKRTEEDPPKQDLGDFEDSALDVVKNISTISTIEYGQLLAMAATKKVSKDALDKRVKEKWDIDSASQVKRWMFEEMMDAFKK